MSGELYLASTYLKVVARSDPTIVPGLEALFGKRAHQVLSSDYIYGDDIHAIFSAFQAQGLNSWLLRYGDQLDVASHGVLGFAVLSSPDLATAMQVLADFLMIRSSAYKCRFYQSDGSAELHVRDLTDDPVVGDWLIESGFRVAQQLIETVMAHPLGEHASIHFIKPRPKYFRALEKFYAVRCEFSQPSNKIVIPASWCSIQNPLYDESNFKANLAKCRELKVLMAGDAPLAERIAVHFGRYFNDRFSNNSECTELPSLQTFANDLGMSSRTLARKLDQQQTSYKMLLEDARQAQARYLLENTHLSIADVAYNLAYQEPANFVRAFKSWFSITPAVWRRNSIKPNNERQF